MPEHALRGCAPEPLSDYLKALAVLRLVHRTDPEVRGRWDGEDFVLTTRLTREELLAFFAESYRPSPILSAWNGAGGLFRRPRKDPKTKEILAYDKPTANSRATDALAASTAERLASIRGFIATAREGADRLGLVTSPDSKSEKPLLLQWLRDHVDDDVLPWLDAAFVMEDVDTPRYPPILGTGGNDGALDFANNFQSNLAAIIDLQTGAPADASKQWLEAALFGTPVAGLTGGTPGQFDAARAGAINGAQGFGGRSVSNPWDFVLFMEGALTFAGSATKRLEAQTPGAMAFPFTVRSTGAGSGTLALADEASGSTRHEVWLPLWSSGASWREVDRVFREGRATVGRRPARDGTDFARAVGSLGVDRGLTGFVRYGFLQRNGLAYVATPLGRWSTGEVPELSLIDAHLDSWLERLRRVGQDDKTPGAMRRAYRRVNAAIMALAGSGTSSGSSQRAAQVQELLVAIAMVDAFASRSRAVRENLRPSPAPRDGGAAARWAKAADDGSAEYRLALALVGSGARARMLPLDQRGGWGDPNDPRVVWTGRSWSTTSSRGYGGRRPSGVRPTTALEARTRPSGNPTSSQGSRTSRTSCTVASTRRSCTT